MQSGAVVVGHDNITAECGCRYLALRCVDEWAETSKDLDGIQSRIAGLLISSAKLTDADVAGNFSCGWGCGIFELSKI